MAVNYEGKLQGHRGWVTSIACPQSADSYLKVVSASRDKTMISWTANQDRHSEESDYAIPDRRFEGHSGFVSDVSLASNGDFAVTASCDRSLRLWNLRTGQCQHKFLKHTKDVLAVDFSPDNRQIVSGGRDNILRVWNVLGECVHELVRDAHTDWVSCVHFSPAKDPLMVSGSWDNTVKVWDLSQGKAVHTLKGHSNYVTSVTVSPDGSLCASAGKDGVARLWDINRGESLYELTCGEPINQICFSPNRYWMCAATEKSIRIYDLENKDVIAELSPETEKKVLPRCMSIAWSADGSTLYSGYTDNIIRVWGLASQ